MTSVSAGTPQTIGAATNADISRVNIPTTIMVTAFALPARVTELRAMEAAGVRLARKRILAKLSDISWPETGDVLVNVFVDCSYLSPETPCSDPHYAGSFSFFGSAKAMPGMPSMSLASFVVDITRPAREQGEGRCPGGEDAPSFVYRFQMLYGLVDNADIVPETHCLVVIEVH